MRPEPLSVHSCPLIVIPDVLNRESRGTPHTPSLRPRETRPYRRVGSMLIPVIPDVLNRESGGMPTTPVGPHLMRPEPLTALIS